MAKLSSNPSYYQVESINVANFVWVAELEACLHQSHLTSYLPNVLKRAVRSSVTRLGDLLDFG